MELTKLSKTELLVKCEELGIQKCTSKNKTELIELINKNANITVQDELIIESCHVDADGDLDEDDDTKHLKIKEILSNIIKKFPSEIKTKIDNINKAADDTAIPCTTKRVSQNSRLYVPYSLVRKNNLTLEQLNTHLKGVCIGIPYNVYEEMRDNAHRDELDEYFIQNIGSNNIISCIIIIMKTEGYSGSGEQRKQMARLTEEAKKQNWSPVTRKENIKNINSGNDKWDGHYYYNICGGEQECLKSWVGKEPQIFTTYKNFMSSEKIILDNKACLIYSLLHVHDITSMFKVEDVSKYLKELEEYLKQTFYSGTSCFELIIKLRTISKDGQLVSPILCKKISIEDFRVVKQLNISHNEAVCKNKIYFCENNKKMLSDYRPGNLFWDFHSANMRQQDETIEEYWISYEQASKLRDSIY
jgi:hypothetical protein